MQNKNFLFDRSILSRNTSVKLLKLPTNTLSQFNLFDRQSFEENSSTLYSGTPVMEKKSVTPPKAPVKNKTLFKKVDLKPKKLHYTEDELNGHSIDSGIFNQFSSSNCTQSTIKLNSCDSPKKQTYNLHPRLDRIKVAANDKENDSSVLNVLNKGKSTVESVVFDPNARALSICFNSDDWKDILQWLQPRRDVGLWIECCREKCRKFRYCDDFHDPVDVPEIWYCEMNSDKSIANCKIPEQPIAEDIAEDLIENAYNAGSIVWARIDGFPWWPAMVDDCPTTFTFYKLKRNSHQPIKYYVTFFNEDKLEYAWICKKHIKPFAVTEHSKLIRKTIYHGVDYKSSLDRACRMASSALSLSVLGRLQKFSFLAQYDKFYGDKNNTVESVNEGSRRDVSEMDTIDSDDEIIPATPTKRRVTCRDVYLKYVKNRNTQ